TLQKTGSFTKEPVFCSVLLSVRNWRFVDVTTPLSSYHIQGNRCFYNLKGEETSLEGVLEPYNKYIEGTCLSARSN
ncbi:hypothetical protein COM04_28490, partial [Bacillus wiedmannii]|uniref:hypothetical protein n=1 Tax=Bacillus wiedmannii TaxID=1890302 RepID=UPI000C002E78